jgi:ABC-type nitrate/sulfonate/bicarbonate transport system substrate-binding protein
MTVRSARKLAVLVTVVCALLTAPVARAQMEEATLAVPAVSLTFSSTLLAEELRLWEKEGLRVRTSIVSGVGATNAVLSSSVDFGLGGGAVLMRATARGQQLFAIAQLMDRMTQEAVLRRDLAEKAGITPETPIAKRAQALRGTRIAVDGVNSINHDVLRYLARKGGLDANKDVTVTPMQPPNMIAALKSGSIDGFVMSVPWPVMVSRDRSAITLASVPRGDLPELSPYPLIQILTRPGFCEAKASVCRKMVAGYKRALTMIHDNPAGALETLRKKFDKTDADVLSQSFELARAATSRTGLIPEAGLKRALDFQLEVGAMKPEEKVPSLAGLYTNKFVQP